MIPFDLKQVEEAPRLGKLIVIVKESGVSLGQVVGVIFPVDLDSLGSKTGSAVDEDKLKRVPVPGV